MVVKGGLLLLITALLAQIGSELKAADPPTIFENTGQVVLAVMFVIGNGITAWMTIRKDRIAQEREDKQRAWLVEDRKASDEKAERIADRVRTELLSNQKELSHQAWQRADEIKGQIAENTRVSTDAFTAANNVNEKIAAVGAMRRNDHNKSRRSEDVTE